MSGESRTHEMLPWYVNGTLTPEETAVFERHLQGCDECRREKPVLDSLRAELDSRGDEYLADHPEAEELTLAVHGALTTERASAVYRHVSICGRCSLEVRWILGERGGSSAYREGSMWSPSRSTRLSVAAAAVVLLAVALAFLTQGLSNGSVESIAHVHFLDSTSRAGDIETIDLGEEAAGFLLFLQVDLAPGELPLSLAITNAAGNEVHAGRYDEELIRGRYVVLYCRHSLFPPGNYEATITTSRESGSRRTTYQFLVASTL